jgi:hypothetical protein
MNISCSPDLASCALTCHSSSRLLSTALLPRATTAMTKTRRRIKTRAATTKTGVLARTSRCSTLASLPSATMRSATASTLCTEHGSERRRADRQTDSDARGYRGPPPPPPSHRFSVVPSNAERSKSVRGVTSSFLSLTNTTELTAPSFTSPSSPTHKP